MQMFEELSDIFSDQNNYLTSRELLMRVSSHTSLIHSSGYVVFSLQLAFTNKVHVESDLHDFKNY